MKPKKELGQNFLKDRRVIEDLIKAADPQKGDVYLEIGAGLGAVTRHLLPKVKKIIAVEIDHQLAGKLKTNLGNSGKVEIINRDVLELLNNQISVYDCSPNKIIGSIPYQITSPLLHQLSKLLLKNRVNTITLLIQKEVAQKITAHPPQASYLSNFVQTYFSVKIVRNVSRESFHPVPKVDGAIILLNPKGLTPKTLQVDPEGWSLFLHQGFRHPRKMLKSVFDEKILIGLGIKPNSRPAELETNAWQQIYQKLWRPNPSATI